MVRAGLMNADGYWAGGDTLVIQVGDIADRGPDSRQIIEHLRRLQAQSVPPRSFNPSPMNSLSMTVTL